MALLKCPLEGWFFCAQRAKNETPPETPKLKVREVSQIGFSNMSLHPTSVPRFSQIGQPQLLAPGTIYQTMTPFTRGVWFKESDPPRVQRAPTSVHPPFSGPPGIQRFVIGERNLPSDPQLVARQIFYVHVWVNISGFKFISLFGIFRPQENHKLEYSVTCSSTLLPLMSATRPARGRPRHTQAVKSRKGPGDTT